MHELLKHKPVNRQQRRVVIKLTGEELYKKLQVVAVDGWVMGVNEVLKILPDALNEELGVGEKRYKRVEDNLKGKLEERFGED